MSPHGRIVLLEFNELSPSLMDRFIAMGRLPNFARLREQSQTFISEATERGWELNPWVQWVTVHTGLDYEDHGLIELDQGPNLTKPRVWDVVSQAGLPVLLCGSMNIGYQQPLKGLVMPDPWSTRVQPSDSLVPFFRFVQQNVLEHSTRPNLSSGDYARFITFMMGHGLSFATVEAIVRQLASEKLHNGVNWKRAVLLDKLQFDVFRWHYRKLQPAFSTFFSNSTAHFQHYHWREMEPHLFKVQPTPEQLSAHDRTILFGYEEMDAMIGRFLALVEPDTIIVFATAISQQPCLVYEDQGGKVMYRPKSMDALLQFAGVRGPYTSSPLMAEVFNVEFRDPALMVEAERQLNQVYVGDRPALLVAPQDHMLRVKCQLHDAQPPDAMLVHRGSGASAPFFDLLFELESIKSGMHHPDGILWVRVPGRAGNASHARVPLASVAPTMLSLMGLPVPAHMPPAIAALARAGRPAVTAAV